MILVTGASGKTGQSVLQALAQRGAFVRVLARRAEQVTVLQTLGAQDVQVGDLRTKDDLVRACVGMDAVYHICPNMQPDEIEIGQRVLAACQAQGVSRFVYHSVLHPQTAEMPHHWHKLRVEELIFKTDLDYTILQPAAYMQNVLAEWRSIVDEGLYRVPYAVETRLGMVDLDDVAEAAAIVLTEAGHAGATYELCSSELLTPAAVAAILADTLRRPVAAQAVDRAMWEAAVREAGLGEYAVATLLKMFAYYELYGFGGNSWVLRSLLGRAPRTFRDFVQGHVG